MSKAPKNPTKTNCDDHQQEETHSAPSSKKRKTIYAYIIKAHETVRKRTKETQRKDHEDHIAETEFNSLSHNNLVHKPVPILCAMKILDGNATVDKKWEILKDLPGWRETKVKSKKGHRAGAKRRQNSAFCDAHGLMPLNSELEPKFSKNTIAASYYERTL